MKKLFEMTGEDIAQAREELGTLWGIGRALTRPEFGRALGLSPTNGSDHVLNMEKDKSKVSGPIELLTRLYLSGSVPPDDLEIFRDRGRRRADTETGEMPPARKITRKASPTLR